MSDPSTVQVAVRVRPLVAHELEKGFKEIVEVVPENQQVVIRSCEKAFTFNYSLGPKTPQDELYTKCVAPLLKNLFEGLNVTIFAYGQTGSGKTHSMGTAYDGVDTSNIGVIPRAVHAIFSKIRDQFSVDYSLTVSFTELYREVLYDLLTNKSREQSTLEIREDISKGIYIPNLTEIPVENAEEVLDILRKGSLGRATASTNMNKHSSRSHSIFTVNIAMQHKTDRNENKTSKLHLVDLAGSERPKKTGAQGTTFKEGVDINKGLFVLGNVISALGDEKTQNGFIPYRDSNLTRLLKDSLGGNSVTLMIACVSPADYNLEETISTLRYADRARKIKNKPIVNQDPKTAEINLLKKQVKQLQLQIVGQGGPVISASEIDQLKKEIQELNLKIKDLRMQLSAALLDKTGLHEKLLILQNANELLNSKLVELKSQCDDTFSQISVGVENHDLQTVKENLTKLQQIQSGFVVLREEQIKVDSEIRAHEETFHVLVSNARTSLTTSVEVQEKEASHTDRQMVLNSEYHEVSKKLALKEQLAAQLAANTKQMIDHQSIMETERKIEALEKEKDDLLQQLRTIKSHENSNKVAENRRKRVQELEDQLKDLKKKVIEQSRLLKLKEKDEMKIKQLHQEITNMKNTKVRLVKQMREEGEHFRSWKQKHDRELAKIKQQDQKKQTEMAKMKVTYEKQKNVLKRKFEEAAALNKRLQNTLLKRKHAQETRFTGKVEKVASWLKDELDVFVNLAEAEATLSGLLEDRATLQHQLDELKNNPETAESPEVKNLEEDIELRSVQIQDLQQQVLDSDEESKAKVRFDAVQTMVEAKYALRCLFDQAAQYHRNHIQTKREITEIQEVNKELQDKLHQLNLEMTAIENNFSEQLANEQKTYQEKVGILLKQMRGTENEYVDVDSKLLERCNIQAEKIEHQETVIEEQNRKIGLLIQRLDAIQETSKKSGNITVPQPDENQTLKVPRSKTYTSDEKVEEFVSDTSFEIDDNERDPDWRKTPLAKRVLTFKKDTKKAFRPSQLINTTKVAGSKRSSEGGCACKKCSTQRCKCRKLGNVCAASCKCSSDCSNRDASNDTSSEFKSASDNSLTGAPADTEDIKKPKLELDSTFVKPAKRRLQKVKQPDFQSDSDD